MESEVRRGDAQQEQEISISQLIGIVKQRRIWILVFLVLALALAIAYLYIANPTYKASVSAFVEPITNANSIENLLSVNSSSSKIDTEIQLITSVTNLKNALAMLDLSKYPDPDGIPYSEKKIDINDLAKQVSVTTVSNTKIVKVSIEDGNAQFCADFANAVIASYTTMLTGISKHSKSAQREFLEMQIPETEELLKNATQAFTDYKKQSGITQLSEKSKLLTSKIAAFQLETEPLKLQLIESRSMMNSLNSSGSLLSADEIKDKPEVSGLLSDYVANSKELIMYTNVESSAGTARIYVLENAIAAREKDIINAVTGILGVRNSGYAKAVTDYLCVSASIESIESIIDMYNKELDDYPIIEREYLEYQRDVEIYEKLLLSLRQLLEETKMVEAAVVGNVNVIDEAVVPLIPISPKKALILAAAVVGGIIIGILFGFMLEFFDDTIRSEETVINLVGGDVPILGWTPYIKDVDKVKKEFPALFVLNDYDAPVSERFRAIANNIAYSLPEKLQVLSINSTDMNEGKTTVICNISASYAMAGKKVLLIDGDFRKPAIEPFFKLKRSRVGFVDATINNVPLEKCIIRPLEEIPGLHILPPGSGTRNPNALFNSDKMTDMMTKLKAVYDVIIIDCPPLSYGSEFTHLAKHLDGFILNIRAGVSSKSQRSNFVKKLEFIPAPLLGFIYYGVVSGNQSGSHISNYGGYYGYGKGYKNRYGQYGNGEKSIYEEGRGSYMKLYKKELKKRDEIAYGKREPVLAFANGGAFAFGTPQSSGESLNNNLNDKKNSAVNDKLSKSVKPVSENDLKTEEMLSAIEKTYKN